MEHTIEYLLLRIEAMEKEIERLKINQIEVITECYCGYTKTCNCGTEGFKNK